MLRLKVCEATSLSERDFALPNLKNKKVPQRGLLYSVVKKVITLS